MTCGNSSSLGPTTWASPPAFEKVSSITPLTPKSTPDPLHHIKFFSFSQSNLAHWLRNKSPPQTRCFKLIQTLTSLKYYSPAVDVPCLAEFAHSGLPPPIQTSSNPGPVLCTSALPPLHFLWAGLSSMDRRITSCIMSCHRWSNTAPNIDPILMQH